MINSLTTHLKEETSEDIEHKVWCVTELTTNTQPREEKTAIVEKLHTTVDELEASMENLAMKVAKLFAQVSNQVTNDPFMKVKKLIQDLIWKQQWKLLRKVYNKLSRDKLTRGSIQCEFHPQWGEGDKRRGYQGCAGSSIEPDAGNSDSDELLYEGDSERLREARVGDHSERVRSCTHF